VYASVKIISKITVDAEEDGASTHMVKEPRATHPLERESDICLSIGLLPMELARTSSCISTFSPGPYRSLQ
jgi:hypothetical protein